MIDDKTCVVKFEDEKFSDDDLIDEFVIDAAIWKAYQSCHNKKARDDHFASVTRIKRYF